MMNLTEKELPFVSVITLSYNSEFIFETIDSVITQTYPNIQYIISDDGSEGFSVRDIKEYIRLHNTGNIKDLVVHHHEENIGTVRNLNHSLAFARGDIVLYLSADDLFYDSDVICDWVDYFKDGKYQIATALRAVYDEALQNHMETLPSEEQVALIKKENNDKIFEKLTKANFIFHCNIAYTREFMKEHLPYNEEYRLIEDHPMNLRWVREGVVFGFHERITLKYRCGGVSAPVHCNSRYLKDVKQIYHNEILPYTTHPFRTRFCHTKWLVKHIYDSHFFKGYELCKKHQSLWIFLAVAHPVRACRKIIRMIKKAETLGNGGKK